MSIIERTPGETDFDYHKRLIYGKLVDKTLADVDYTELSELVYGQPYSSDVARRMMYGSRRTLDLIGSEAVKVMSNGDGGSSFIDNINEKLDEYKRERQKFFDQRREYNKLVNSDGRREHLYDKLVEAAHNLNDTIGLMYNDYGTHQEESNAHQDNEAVLVLSDWHYGMTTNNVFNKYSTKICQERVKEIADSAVDRIIRNKCRKLHIVVLGDLIHGAIHVSARVASEELVCDQLMQVSEILAQTIQYISTAVDETYVYVTYGNHARTVANKQDNIHRDNMERIIPWWLEQRFSGMSNIFIVPESENEFLFINASASAILAAHGDLDGIKTSPRLLSTLFQKKYNKNVEYIVLGDKHHRESFEELGVTSAICGSLCGTDDYANGKRLFSTPSQLLLIVNQEAGVDAEYHLKCKNI